MCANCVHRCIVFKMRKRVCCCIDGCAALPWCFVFGACSDHDDAVITPSTTNIRGSGGSSITLDISGITLRDWDHATLELTADCNGANATYAGAARSPGSIFFRTDSSVNTVLCAPGSASGRLSLNGQDFTDIEGIVFNIDDRPAYKVLFVYISPIDDFGWTYAQNLGRLAVAEQFGVSIDTPYIENIPV